MRRPVYGLKQRWTGSRWVEIAACGVTNPARHRPGEVTQYVAKQIVRDNYSVSLGVIYEIDARGIDVLVVSLDVRKFGRHFFHHALPQVTGEGQNVRLVYQGDFGVVQTRGTFEGETNTALDAVAGVHRALCRHLEGRTITQHATLTGVGALGVLTHNGEGATFGNRSRNAVKRSVIDIKV